MKKVTKKSYLISGYRGTVSNHLFYFIHHQWWKYARSLVVIIFQKISLLSLSMFIFWYSHGKQTSYTLYVQSFLHLVRLLADKKIPPPSCFWDTNKQGVYEGLKMKIPTIFMPFTKIFNAFMIISQPPPPPTFLSFSYSFIWQPTWWKFNFQICTNFLQNCISSKRLAKQYGINGPCKQ